MKHKIAPPPPPPQTHTNTHSTQGMGVLLNNSNGCPRMPIRNTTPIKAMSILGVERRPCSKWRHYSCYPREDAALRVFLRFLSSAYLFCSGGGMFRFWWRTTLRGQSDCQWLYPRLNSASELVPRWKVEKNIFATLNWAANSSRKGNTVDPAAPYVCLQL